MLQRRLVLSSSSDEDDERHSHPQPQHDHQESQPQPPPSLIPSYSRNSIIPNPNPNLATPNPSSVENLEISDDDEDFIDVSDTLSPPLPPNPNPKTNRNLNPPPPPRPPSTGRCPISEILCRLGLRLKREWLDSCVRGLEEAVPSFGTVEELEAARQRLVDEVNKPPRGIRTRGGVVPPLRTRATLAAWLSNGAHAAGNANNMTYEETTPFRVHNQGATHVAHGTIAGQRIEAEFHGVVSEENAIHNPSSDVVMDVEELPIPFATQPSNGAHAAGNVNNMTSEHTTPFQVQNQGPTHIAHGIDAGQRIEGELPGVVSEESATCNPSTNVVMDVEELPIASAESTIPNLSPQVVTGAEDAHEVVMSMEEVHAGAILNSREIIMPNSLSDAASIVEGIDMDMISSRMENRVEEIDVDMLSLRMDNPVSDTYPDDVLNDEEIRPADEVEHSNVLSGNREIPFTYLASLSAKWTAMEKKASSVKGIIKCFLTIVKRFSTNYELRVYVDDGSLISEVFIHHDAVQKLVGHSPQEVKAALSLPDSKSAGNMRETMKQLQSFLSNFKGKMLIDVSEASPLPVALEMNEGCSESDARLLLQRLKSSVSAQT